MRPCAGSEVASESHTRHLRGGGVSKKPSKVVPLRDGVTLSPEHREHLRTSGLTDAQMERMKVFSESSAGELKKITGRSAWRYGAAIVFPSLEPGRADPLFYRVRPDRPPIVRDKKGKERKQKYIQPAGVGFVPYFTPRAMEEGWYQDASRPLFWTEGEKKAALLDQLGFAAIGGAGVWNFHDVDRKTCDRVWMLHPLTRKHALIAERHHVIVFDADAVTNDDVLQAERRLAGILEAAGALTVSVVRIPMGGPKGIDDFFVARGEAATRELLDKREPIEGLPASDPLCPLRLVRALKGADIPGDQRLPTEYDIDKQGRPLEEGARRQARHPRPPIAPMLIRRIVKDLYSGEERVELVFRREGAWRTVLVDRVSFCDARKLVEAVSPFGAPVASTNAGEIVKWLAKLEYVNESRIPRATCVTRCGWHERDARLFMAPGLVEQGEDGIVFDGRVGRAVVSGLGTKGSADTHLEALRSIFAQDTLAATAICAALAAPMLAQLHAPNFAIHLAGDSSRGKSTMLRAGASIYGDPNSGSWVASWNSTSVGLEERAHILSDLPFCVDESGVADPRILTNAIYMLINGVGRARGKKTGGLRDMLSWRTVVVSTGERKLVSDRANTGAQTRVLQGWVDGLGEWGAPEVEAFNATVASHYGHVGERWLSDLARLGDASWEKMRKALKQIASALSKGAKGPRARQAGYVATLVMAERVAASRLGIGDPQGRTMAQWMSDSFADHTQEIESAAERAAREVGDWIAASRHMMEKLGPTISAAAVGTKRVTCRHGSARWRRKPRSRSRSAGCRRTR